MDVTAWLRDLDLERYAQAFRDNDVDARTLPELTESDLAQIGVKSVGHRRRLVEAIVSLRAGSRPAAVSVARAAAPGVPPHAEHRQLTVLCCDMVGSTALSQRLHPEDMHELIQAFKKACTRSVADYDGYVANFIGDCVLAYFGWPRAHEDDGERAVRAGRATVQAVGALATPIKVRVGIATGTVVTGDLIREGPAQSDSAVGTPLALAEHLQTLATPGQMVIDELTRRLLPPTFAVCPLGRQVLEGITEPVSTWVVQDERQADSRFDARKGDDLPPMIGRDRELALLLSLWAQAHGGEGQAVLLTGEAGIGKSRIARALLDACVSQRHERIRWQCSPYHTGSALWPVIQRLGQAVGITPRDAPGLALDKLEALTGADKEAAAVYAALLGLDGSQRYGPLEMSPQMLRARTLQLLAGQLLERAGQRPVLLVIEDAQWIDPTTLELIETCVQGLDSARLLILITSRPENQPKLAAHASVTRLSLNRLSRTSVEALVERLGGASLAVHTRGAIVEQSDGVPLFAEELTKAVLETGEATVPASLHGSLMARLDRVAEVKEVAQIAACIGREFDQALVQAVAERPEGVVAAIGQLAAAELILRRSDKSHPRFTFKHALLQEAAYDSLLRGQRRRLHARLLEVLEAERPDTSPEILAHHAVGAGQAHKAIRYWSEAGKAALAKSAYVEAAGYLASAIGLIQGQVDGVDRGTLELELQLHLAQALVAAQGFAAPAAMKAFRRAEELLNRVADRGEYAPRAYYGLWAAYFTRIDLKIALDLATRALAAAEAGSRDQGTLLHSHRMVAGTRLLLGHFAAAADHFQLAMGLVDSPRRTELTMQMGVDPGMQTLSYFAMTLCIQGFANQSVELRNRARCIASGVAHLNARMQRHVLCAMCCAFALDLATVQSEAEALAALAARHRLTMHGRYANVLHCWLKVAKGEANEDTLRAYEKGLEALAEDGTQLWMAFFMSWRARALASLGHHRAALGAIDAVIDGCEESAEGWCEAELWRVRGEVLAGEPASAASQAIPCFERALSIARGQGARLWELRAAVGLARLWAAQGDRARALALLVPVYGAFTEGFDTADLVEARALLGTLGHY